MANAKFTRDSLDNLVRQTLAPNRQGPENTLERLRKATRRPVPKLPRGIK
jgi:hypothetical protein